MSLQEDIKDGQNDIDSVGLATPAQHNLLEDRLGKILENAYETGGRESVSRTLRMYNVMLTLLDLWLLKNTKYDDSFLKSVKKRGLITALTRLEDKWSRFVAMVEGGSGTEDESIVDTAGDAANYFMMTLDAIVNEKVEA